MAEVDDRVPVTVMLTARQAQRLDAFLARIQAVDTTIEDDDVADAVFEAGLAQFEANFGPTWPTWTATDPDHLSWPSSPLLDEKRMNLKIKKLYWDAKTPTYATDGAGCFDLYAHTVAGSPVLNSHVDPGFPVLCGTGLAFEVPEGWVMNIYSRSGSGFKHDTRLANCVGVIDSDYRGEVFVKLTADDDASRHGTPFESPLLVAPGDRIAQAMLVRADRVSFEIIEKLSTTVRGAGGFGSTGAR